MIASSFYPVGLIIGALAAVRWVLTDVEIPFISRGLAIAAGMVVLFIVIGSFATWVSSKIFKKYLYEEIVENE
jgi:hypothetical protein